MNENEIAQKMDLVNRANQLSKRLPRTIQKPASYLKQSTKTLPLQVAGYTPGPKFPASQIADGKTLDALFGAWSSQELTNFEQPIQTEEPLRDLFTTQDDLFSSPKRKRPRVPVVTVPDNNPSSLVQTSQGRVPEHQSKSNQYHNEQRRKLSAKVNVWFIHFRFKTL